jgi:FAD/FMN-containing dehydrogenases
MASHADLPEDPAVEGDYDYEGGEIHRPELLSALEPRVDGDVRFDDYSRRMYATDASAYEVAPIGVVLPESTADVASVLSYCAEEGIPVLPRVAPRRWPGRRSTRQWCWTSPGIWMESRRSIRMDRRRQSRVGQFWGN